MWTKAQTNPGGKSGKAQKSDVSNRISIVRPTIARSPLSQYQKGAGGFSPSTRLRMTRATYRPSFGSSARNTAEYLFATSCRMALTSLGVKELSSQRLLSSNRLRLIPEEGINKTFTFFEIP